MSVFPHQAACSAYQSLGIILILMIKYLKTKKRLLYEGWLLPSKCRKLVNCRLGHWIPDHFKDQSALEKDT